MKISLELLANQRNYIAHCIFGELDNFFEEDNLRIDKSNKPRVALPTEDLVEEDVLTYSEYFNETVKNLIFIIEIFEEKVEISKELSQHSEDKKLKDKREEYCRKLEIK